MDGLQYGVSLGITQNALLLFNLNYDKIFYLLHIEYHTHKENQVFFSSLECTNNIHNFTIEWNFYKVAVVYQSNTPGSICEWKTFVEHFHFRTILRKFRKILWTKIINVSALYNFSLRQSRWARLKKKTPRRRRLNCRQLIVYRKSRVQRIWAT